MTPSNHFKIARRIEFADTDVSGIVHFSRFFVFMETAEHEFLRSLGTSVHLEDEGRQIGWPRVEASCKYVAPAHFGDVIDIEVNIARRGKKSMSYSFLFLKDDETIAEGKMTSVCCVLDGGRLEAIQIPAVIAQKIDRGT